MRRLSVVGALHLDVVVEATHLPRLDETVIGTNVKYLFGGKGGNQAIAADSHGANVCFIGRVGSDAFGKKILATINNGSIDVSQLQIDSDASGMSVAIVEQEGDYGAVIVSGANLRIDTKFSITKDTGILLIQNEVPDAVNLAASQKAKGEGAEVWLNAAPARKIPDELLENLDVLILNRVETKFYNEILNLPECSHITKILTLGAEGVKIQYPDNRRQYFPAYLVETRSTHGAGDVFIGALAACRLNKENFEQAIKYAQAAAALKVSTETAESKKIIRKDVLEFLKTQTAE